MAILNFNEIKRPSLDIVLNDEDKTKLSLITPAKYKVDEFMLVFQNLVNKENKDITMDDLYEVASTILSSNNENIKVSKEKVQSIFMLDDIIILMKHYNRFIVGLYNTKN